MNKKVSIKIVLLSLIVMVTTISAYGQGGRTLVVYYSRSGNTQAIANHIVSLTGADLFRIETVTPYPEQYRATTEIAKEEKNSNARPPIEGGVENIDQYDTVFIGFPVWWGTYPMAMATFLEAHDLDGRIVIPFCTHGGGGVDQGFNDVRSLSPRSVHRSGLSLNGNRANSAKDEIEKWLREVGSIE